MQGDHYAWAIVAGVLVAVVFWKCVEIGYDIRWAARSGRNYQRDALRELRESGSVSIDKLDRSHRRWQPLWQLASKGPFPLRAFVGMVFRVPTLVVLQTVTLFFVPATLTAADRAVLGLTALSLWSALTVTVTKEFVHRVTLGWFYCFRRDVALQPSGSCYLDFAELNDDGMLSRILRLLALLIFVLILAFGSIYYSVATASPSSFDLGCTNSKMLSCFYFSAVTMATVGYGDVKPTSELGQAVVMSQLVMGPFVLTLLVLALSAGLAALPSLEEPR